MIHFPERIGTLQKQDYWKNMQLNVLLKPEAFYDIDEIIARYEEKKKGLGFDFIHSFVVYYG